MASRPGRILALLMFRSIKSDAHVWRLLASCLILSSEALRGLFCRRASLLWWELLAAVAPPFALCGPSAESMTMLLTTEEASWMFMAACGRAAASGAALAVGASCRGCAASAVSATCRSRNGSEDPSPMACA